MFFYVFLPGLVDFSEVLNDLLISNFFYLRLSAAGVFAGFLGISMTGIFFF